MRIAQEKIDEICWMRKKGMSVNEIVSKSGLSKSTVWWHIKNIKLSKQQRDKLNHHFAPWLNKFPAINKEAYRKKREDYRAKGFNLAKEAEFFRTLCLLYWGEGTKSINIFNISNSDDRMLALAARCLGVWMKKAVVRISCHPQNEVPDLEIERYWRRVFPEGSVRKLMVTHQPYNPNSSGKGKGKLPYGTANIRICSVELVQMVYGGIDFLARIA